MNNEQVLLAKYPEGMPQDDTFKYENIYPWSKKMT